ncbi:MAG TPA: TauD/TfdA family dioxygenase [Aquella sp.]|nr:TauD/TfdA family dioxygenase [Aquella sp.]
MQNTFEVSDWHSHVRNFLNTSINPYQNLEGFLENAQVAMYNLPYSAIKSILNFKAGYLSGFLILKGFVPDPDLIPTYEDIDKIYNNKQTFYSEFWLALVAKILGEPIGYAQERNGAVLQNVRPRKGQETKIASDSSAIVLDLHVENGYHPIRPDFLMLQCLRSDRSNSGHTMVLDIMQILPFFSDEELAILKSKQFKTSVDWNFGNFDAQRGSGPTVSILFGSEANPLVFYDDEYIIGITCAAQVVLDKFRELLHKHVIKILLQPGEMLVIDNYKCVHGRTAFHAYYDGQDRWLQRMLVVRDLSLNQKLLNNTGRILDWTYKPNTNYSNVIY